jgi:hypothetical protein
VSSILFPNEKPTPAGLSIKSMLEFLVHDFGLYSKAPDYTLLIGPKPAKVKLIEAPPGPPLKNMINGSEDLFPSDSVSR